MNKCLIKDTITREVVSRIRQSKHKLSCVPKNYKSAKFTKPVEVVYTDGSVRKTDMYCGIGVWYDDLCSRNMSYRVDGRLDSNRAELCAIFAAISTSDLQMPLCLYTDSMTSMTLLQNYYYNNKTHPSYDILLYYISLCLDLRNKDTTLIKVPAHKDVHGNVEADKLAKSAGSDSFFWVPDNTIKHMLEHYQKGRKIIIPNFW
jgi:ribonuclease HI